MDTRNRAHARRSPSSVASRADHVVVQNNSANVINIKTYIHDREIAKLQAEGHMVTSSRMVELRTEVREGRADLFNDPYFNAACGVLIEAACALEPGPLRDHALALVDVYLEHAFE